MKLVNVPAVMPFESIASWISRFAFSQGISLSTLLKKMDIAGNSDIDFIEIHKDPFINENLDSDSLKRLKFSRKMMRSAQATGLPEEDCFLSDERGRPRYRYCPVCLHVEKRAVYFQLHWRFVMWRYCPLHDCLMYDRCYRCNCYLVFPLNLLKPGHGKQGMPNLRHCASCGASLSRQWKYVYRSLNKIELDVHDRLLLNNGRAFLSAMDKGILYYRHKSVVRRLGFTRQLKRMFLLPGQAFDHRFNQLHTQVDDWRSLTSSKFVGREFWD